MTPRVSSEYERRRRERILQAAVERFSEKGFHRTTVQDICDAAELSKGALYLYFKSKEELLAAVVGQSITDSLRQAQEAAAGGGSALEKLDRIAAVILERLDASEVCAQSPQVLLEMWAEASKNPQVNTLYAEGYRRWRAFLADLLREGIAQGTLKPWLDPEALAEILVAVFDGLSLQEGITRTKIAWRSIAETLRRGLSEGVITAAAIAV